MTVLRKNLTFSQKNFPWFLLGMSILAFGMIAPWLGFYQDDWHHIYYFTQGGIKGHQSFQFTDSRPFTYLLYIPFFKIIGVKPFYWQLVVLFFRFLTAISFWAILNRLWEKHIKHNAIIAALFLIYPVFQLQPLAVTYTEHWTMYFLYMLSVWLMLKANNRASISYPLIILALLFQAVHLLMIEYYVGIELLRPLFLFILFRETPIKNRLLRSLKASLPFLIITIAYVIFRSSYNVFFGYDRNTPVILLQLLQSPLQTIPNLIQILLQDFAELFFTAWYDILQPAIFTWKKRSDLFVWLGIIIFGFIWMVYFSVNQDNQSDLDTTTWAREILLVGFFAAILGAAPGWAVGKTVHLSNPLWNDRFAMASMFGAAMLITGFIFLLFKENQYPFIFAGILISLAVGANLRSAITYKLSWEKQQKFYWQLYWRAPDIEKNTAFVSDSEFLFYMGAYPTAFAINTLYDNVEQFNDINYWLYVGGEHLPHGDYYQPGVPISFEKYASVFEGNTDQTLPILFEPDAGQCLWILRPEDRINRNLPDLTIQYAKLGNLDTIKRESNLIPREDIFGPEPAHDRCYYYQKADLARQYGAWDEVIAYWNEAKTADLLPYSGVEYIPFIEAFAHTGDWGQAEKLTLRANKLSDRMPPYLCGIWKILDYTSAPVDVRETLSNRLSCEALLSD